MSNRCHISTRKGLFTLERGASGWEIARASFVGDNCTLAMHDARNSALVAALNHGHFGVKLHRSTDGGTTWSEIATPKYPEKPADYVPKIPVEGMPAEWSLKLVWALAPGGAERAGRHLVRHAARRPVPLGRRRRVVGARPAAVGPPAARGVVRRRRRPPRHPLDLRRPARRRARHRRRLVRRRLDHARRRRRRGSSAAAGMRAEFMPPEQQFEPEHPGSAPLAQCRGQPGRALGPAPQRHLPLDRRGRLVDRDRPTSRRRRSASPVAVHPRDPDTAWFVPAVKDEKRYPVDGKVVVNRTRDGGKTLRDAVARPAAGARLRPRLPPRARRRRHRHPPGDGIDHRVGVDQRGRRRFVAGRVSNLPPVYAVCFEKHHV